MANLAKQAVIPNQVFVGCPYKTIRPKYEKLIASLVKKYPLSFVIVGRDASQEAGDLLEMIKQKLAASSFAIFDATGGNANVSLEFGYAEANDIPRALYISSHKASVKQTEQSPIISDLAGKRRNVYKTENSLAQLLSILSRTHNYTKQFEKAIKSGLRNFSRGKKKRYRALALKIVHSLDGIGRIRRTDLLQSLRTLVQNYKESEIDKVISLLHREDLVISEKGRYSGLRMI